MKIVFRNFQAPGDIVAMTGSIRDLKKQYPEYEIKMDTSCGDIWLNNPNISHFNNSEADGIFKLDYEDVHNSGISGRHFSSAFHLTIEKHLSIRLVQSEIWPEIYLTDQEKETPIVEDKYWIINSGYKNDFPLKSWGHSRYQRVVDLLKNKIKFVQVGEKSFNHNHKPLNGVIDMVGKTSLRDYIRLAYHSEGSLGPVSMHMHISAAFRKPCVIVAGGREPFRWESYPNQRYICTNGFLDCCRADGCWKNIIKTDAFKCHEAKKKKKADESTIIDLLTKCKRSDLAEIFGVTLKTIQDWNNDFNKIGARNPNGTVNAIKVIQWRFAEDIKFLNDKSKKETCTNTINGEAKCMTMIDPEFVAGEILRYE